MDERALTYLGKDWFSLLPDHQKWGRTSIRRNLHQVEAALEKTTDRTFNITQKKKLVDYALKAFETAFSQLFEIPTQAKPNPEYLLGHAKPILDLFEHGLELSLKYNNAKVNETYSGLEKAPSVSIKLKYAGENIDKPHLFLNEARLSAIAISIYLGMIKRHPQLKPFKILFLDDVFIGLDISNRLPLLRILETHFSEYQIFVTTYDKPWYEFVKSFSQDSAGWKTLQSLQYRKT